MSFGGKKVIALIPARGGSKGIFRKNLCVVRGRPLVAHSLQAAFDSTIIDQVFLSSDDDEILSVGRALGALLHRRLPEAASDTATASDVVNDFLTGLSSELVEANPYMVFLQPTSPLRTGSDIDTAFAVLESNRATMCIGVQEVTKTPFKSFTLDASGRMQSLFDEHLTNANRQDLPKVYHPNGAIYIFPLAEFIRRGGFPSNGAVPYVMSECNSIDVDSERDLIEIESLCFRK